MPQLFTSAFLSRVGILPLVSNPSQIRYFSNAFIAFHHLVLLTRTVVFEIKGAATSTSLVAASFRMNGGFKSLECGHFLSH
jgi:hypothetical protein